MKNNVAIFLKRLRSRDMANMHNQHWLTSTRFSPFSAPWTKGLCIQVQRCSKPTHDHAARGRPRTALRGPAQAHQLAVPATAYVATPTAALISARGLVVWVCAYQNHMHCCAEGLALQCLSLSWLHTWSSFPFTIVPPVAIVCHIWRSLVSPGELAPWLKW